MGFRYDDSWWRVKEFLEGILLLLVAIPALVIGLLYWTGGWAADRVGIRRDRIPWWVHEWVLVAASVVAGSIVQMHFPAWQLPPRHWGQIVYLSLVLPTAWVLARVLVRRRLGRLAPHVAQAGGRFVEIRDVRRGRLLMRVPGTGLAGRDLAGAPLAGADLWRADLSRADLRGADLRGAYLVQASLEGADLRDARLVGAFLQKANLIDVDLEHADLEGANLHGAVYSRREWRHHRLMGDCKRDHTRWPAGFNPRIHDAVALGRGARLDRTQLVGADLRCRDLTLANLRQADLRQADLSGADLSFADLSGALYDARTRWPCPEGADFDPSASGARLVEDHDGPVHR